MTKVSSFSQSNTLSSVTENYFWFLVIFMALFGFVLGGFFFSFLVWGRLCLLGAVVLGGCVFSWCQDTTVTEVDSGDHCPLM